MKSELLVLWRMEISSSFSVKQVGEGSEKLQDFSMTNSLCNVFPSKRLPFILQDYTESTIT
jgi:hypothetical protein